MSFQLAGLRGGPNADLQRIAGLPSEMPQFRNVFRVPPQEFISTAEERPAPIAHRGGRKARDRSVFERTPLADHLESGRNKSQRARSRALAKPAILPHM